MHCGRSPECDGRFERGIVEAPVPESIAGRAPALRSVALLVVLLSLQPFAVGAQSAASLSGAQAFAACAACHNLEAGQPHKVGPNLHGVVGRAAASAEGFSYSPALRESGLVWTRDTLFAWIAGSEALVPGSWMLYHNLLSGTEVLRLIDHIADGSE